MEKIEEINNMQLDNTNNKKEYETRLQNNVIEYNNLKKNSD